MVAYEHKDKFTWNALCNSKNLEILQCPLISDCIMVQYLQKYIRTIKNTDSTNLERFHDLMLNENMLLGIAWKQRKRERMDTDI